MLDYLIPRKGLVMEEKVIFEYVKDENGQRRGVLAATSNGPFIGFSALHPRDKFSKEVGLRIAEGRARMGTMSEVPYRMQEQEAKFRDRATRYFKRTF